MIQIALVVVGIIFLFIPKVTIPASLGLKSSRELKRPRIFIFSAIAILTGVYMYFFGSSDSLLAMVAPFLVVIIPLLALVLLSQKNIETVAVPSTSSDKTKISGARIVNVVTWTILLAILAGGIYLWLSPKLFPVTQGPVVPAEQNILIPSDEAQTAGQQTYKNIQYGFAMDYPFTWKMEENKISSGITHVIFSKNDYKINVFIDNMGGGDQGKDILATGQEAANNFTFLPSFLGQEIWRDVKPNLNAVVSGNIYGFAIDSVMVSAGTNGAGLKYTYNSFVKDGNITYFIQYLLPEGVTDANYDKNTVKEMDQIISSVRHEV